MTNTTSPHSESLSNQIYGTFRLGSDEFGICASAIREVINAPERISGNPLYPDYVLGTLTLRDTIIPVIDMTEFFGRMQSHDEGQRKVAIIDYHGQPIGLLFDQTGDVFHGRTNGCEYVECAELRSRDIALGAFWFQKEERVVQVLDAHSIIEYHGAPPRLGHQNAIDTEQSKASHRGARFQSITFRLGSLELAIDMGEVREVLAGGLIDDKELAEGALLGAFDLRGQAVPLIDLKSAFQIASERVESDLSGSRIVIAIRDDKPIGLVVDVITGLVNYYADEVLSYPAFAQNAPELFVGCIQNGDEGELIQLNLSQLFELPSVSAALHTSQSLFDRASKSAYGEPAQHAGELTSYLCFLIDDEYAVALSDVIEVVDYPEQLVQPPMLHEQFDGVLNLRGEFVATIAARTLYSLDQTDQHDQHIIVFEQGGHRYGLAVPSVSSIVHVDSSRKQRLPEMLRDKTTSIASDVEEAFLFDESTSDAPKSVSILSLASIVARITSNSLDA